MGNEDNEIKIIIFKALHYFKNLYFISAKENIIRNFIMLTACQKIYLFLILK